MDFLALLTLMACRRLTSFGTSKWKHNVQEISGEVLCVSQFTLLANTKKGNKPDFHGALGGEEAKRLYQYFFDKVQEGYMADKVKNGVFQAMMEVALVNDGPVCLRSSHSVFVFACILLCTCWADS